MYDQVFLTVRQKRLQPSTRTTMHAEYPENLFEKGFPFAGIYHFKQGLITICIQQAFIIRDIDRLL